MFIISTVSLCLVSVAQWDMGQLLGSGKVDCTMAMCPTDKLGLPPEVGPGSGQFVSLSNPDKLFLETLNTREDPWFTIHQHCNQQYCLDACIKKYNKFWILFHWVVQPVAPEGSSATLACIGKNVRKKGSDTAGRLISEMRLPTSPTVQANAT